MSIEELSIEYILIAVLGAALAGFINTLAGNGSAITLTILTELLGLPPVVANGTNRVGILAQSATSFWVYFKDGFIKNLPWKNILIPSILGAFTGGGISMFISNAAFKTVFRWMLPIMLLVVILKPKKWLKSSSSNRIWPTAILALVSFIAGIYGGFIQMGFGPIFLAINVFGAGYDLRQANIYKIVLVAIYTPVLVFFFAKSNLIVWSIGLMMAFGQAASAYLTSYYFTRYEPMVKVAYYVLIFVIIAAILKVFFF